MKTLMLLTVLLSGVSQAQSFQVGADVSVGNLRVTASVYNAYGAYLRCSGRAEGVTVYGQYIYAYMRGVVIPPGQWRHVYVYTNSSNPFGAGDANISCIFI
jgi:hypothetical protein